MDRFEFNQTELNYRFWNGSHKFSYVIQKHLFQYVNRSLDIELLKFPFTQFQYTAATKLITDIEEAVIS